MATIMEKDVLLEYASFGYLIPDSKTEQNDNDLIDMGNLWRKILNTNYKDIDFKETIKSIKAIRDKYERNS